MEITFDKSVQKLLTDALGTLRGRNCFFCGIPLNQKNFAGCFMENKARYLCNNLVCLIEYSDYRKQ